MNILTVTATTRGGFNVEVEGQGIVPVTPGADTPESAALSAWFRAGNRAQPYQPTLDEAKAAAAQEAERQFSALLVTLTGSASIEERDTWAIKETAARAHLAGTANPAQTVMLTSEAGAVGEDVATHVGRIIAKAEAFYAIVGATSGMKRTAHAAIRDATTHADLTAALATLKAQRDAAIAAYAT